MTETAIKEQGSGISPTKPNGSLPAPAQGVHEIALENLQVATTETRKTIDQRALAELADSIRLHGIQEPLLVRPLPAPSGLKRGQTYILKYEIVAGQRRYLASKLADKPTCPCIVRQLSDPEAAERRVISNLQREDLEPIEEAEAYRKLLESPGATVETVAAALAKAPSYVGRRLQLLKAIDPVRAALKAGAIEVGHALELARLTETMQREILASLRCGYTGVDPNDVDDEASESGVCRYCGCTEENACKGGCSWMNAEQTICSNPDCVDQFREETGQDQPGEEQWGKTAMSVAALRAEIGRRSLRPLASAPFPLAADLAPMACTDCPKRSGNAALLFDDCAQDTCTDRRCYDAKVQAWVEAEQESAKKEKRKLLMFSRHWSSDKNIIEVESYRGVFLFKSEHECPHGEEGIWIDGDDAGRRAMVCRETKCQTHRGRSSSYSTRSERKETPAEKEKRKADRRKVLDKVKAAKEYRTSLFAALAKASVPAPSLDQLNLEVCLHVLAHTRGQYEKQFADAIGWDEKLVGYSGRNKLREKLAGMGPIDRLRIAFLSTLADELSVSEYNANGRPEDLEKFAKLLKVDSAKCRTTEKPAAKPAAVKAVAPVKAKPAKKSILSAAAKKRIAAAQKKRWAAAAKKGGKK